MTIKHCHSPDLRHHNRNAINWFSVKDQPVDKNRPRKINLIEVIDHFVITNMYRIHPRYAKMFSTKRFFCKRAF